MNIGKLLEGVARKAKENPELALVVVGLVAPKAVAKAAPIIIAATRKSTEIR